MPRRPRGGTGRRATRVVLALAATTLLLVAGAARAQDPAQRGWQVVLGDRARSAAQGEQRVVVVLAAPSLADRVAATPRATRPREQRRWNAEAGGAQRLLLAALRKRGVVVRRDEVFTRTFNGFSAVVTARALAELERSHAVAGVYQVRTVYPASLSSIALARGEFGPDEGRRPGFEASFATGRGVTIALLDTGVERRHPYLRGRVLRGFDLVDSDRAVSPESRPDEPSVFESHGTRMAGLLVGRNGPAGLLGAAPGARVLPIRVLGWEQTTDGGDALLGRGDLLLAGLERAVDPDQDGDVGDRARIALAPVVEPYAGFADSPEARAVAGATSLGTLVVAAAGNDGWPGAGFGTVGAPAAAPDALAVGALDARRQVFRAQATLTGGSDEILSGPLSLLGSERPAGPQALAVTVLRGPTLAQPERAVDARVDGARLADYFDPGGTSLVAGQAVLLDAGEGALAEKARNAASAGASALLVSGDDLPAGALDLEDGASVPVLALPAEAGEQAEAALAAGEAVSLTLGAAEAVPNPELSSVTPFSSGGLAFDGRVKPDLVAPGVGLATADAGPDAGYATATGTSAAAAVVAGAAALVAEKRPELSAAELRSALVGSATQVLRDGAALPVTTQGAGAVDPDAAAATGLVVEPATLDLGRAAGAGWSAARLVTVTNLTSQRLVVRFGIAADGSAGRALSFAATPAVLRLRPGQQSDVRVDASAREITEAAGGVLVVAADGVGAVRVPWAVAPRPESGRLVGDVALSNSVFSPSDAAPVVLAFRAGLAEASEGGERIEPVGLLEVELWTAGDRNLGVLARLRDVLPGRYAFGLTGRDPSGRVLREGDYVLRLRAHPVDADDGARPSTAQARFTIQRRS
jgi:minor extracellular serine protease Vpr